MITMGPSPATPECRREPSRPSDSSTGVPDLFDRTEYCQPDESPCWPGEAVTVCPVQERFGHLPSPGHRRDRPTSYELLTGPDRLTAEETTKPTKSGSPDHRVAGTGSAHRGRGGLNHSQQVAGSAHITWTSRPPSRSAHAAMCLSGENSDGPSVAGIGPSHLPGARGPHGSGHTRGFGPTPGAPSGIDMDGTSTDPDTTG